MKHEYKETDDFTEDMMFGEFIRKKRRLLGMCQADFGHYIGGYHQHTISMWEIGTRSPSYEEAIRIINLLGGEVKIINLANKKESDLEYKHRINEMCDNYLDYGITQCF